MVSTTASVFLSFLALCRKETKLEPSPVSQVRTLAPFSCTFQLEQISACQPVPMAASCFPLPTQSCVMTAFFMPLSHPPPPKRARSASLSTILEKASSSAVLVSRCVREAGGRMRVLLGVEASKGSSDRMESTASAQGVMRVSAARCVLQLMLWSFPSVEFCTTETL